MLFLGVNAVLRMWLTVESLRGPGLGSPVLVLLLGGAFRDLYPLALVLAVPALWLAVLPERWIVQRWHRAAAVILLTGGLWVLLLVAFAELLFWAEFETRFNFLAVEYLVYRDEIAKNMLESYPVAMIAAALLLVAALTVVLLRRLIALSFEGHTPVRTRMAVASLFVASALAASYGQIPAVGRDARSLEIARNGAYEFVAAFRSNELDFHNFYLTAPAGEPVRVVRARLGLPPLPPGARAGITRDIVADRPERRLNVVVVLVESLSASFLGSFGNRAGLTPTLDRLAPRSLRFTNLFATGTRTVRGLEAVALSIPPTPGHSILKRAGIADLRTIGTPFQDRGYDTKFIYGGYGYFDNMNAFFGANGFEVIDRATLSPKEITFSNAWGVADEDLFGRALTEADRSSRAGRPFFMLTLTTSNHRPYTFPEGRIDRPSRSGRDAAVKYTDYAIGHFLDEAAKREWFAGTLFVIMADHCARSGGRTEIPLQNYLIPAFIYGPGLVEPGTVSTLTSQVDIAPTLLGLLGFSYESGFFGKDVLRERDERAFVATYSSLGLFRNQRLTVLDPDRRAIEYAVRGVVENEMPVDPDDLRETIAYYQAASELYTSGALKKHR